ncbi:MAG: hypothetical protein AB1742_09835 [bacterium]
MDVRLFKLIVFAATEAALAIAWLAARRISDPAHSIHFLDTLSALLAVSIPLFLLLPEDNWVWILEEDPRARKISARSKAVKHLHLSMLYLFALGYAALALCLAALINNPPHGRLLWLFIAGAGAAAGIFCAFRNYHNVIGNESLFALSWDRKAPFPEIFVGLRVSRKPVFFYSRRLIVSLVLLFLASAGAPCAYYLRFSAQAVPSDPEKFVVTTTALALALSFGTWTAAMYTSFQILFARRLERWLRDVKKIPQTGGNHG